MVLSRRPRVAQPVEETPDLVVGVVEERGERLLQPCRQPSLGVGERLPRLDARVAIRQLGVGRDDPELLLALEPTLTHDVPTLVVAPPVLVAVGRGGLVGGVGGPEGEPREDRPVGSDVGRGSDHLEGPVDQVLAQVVAVLGCRGRVDVVVVDGERRVELVGLAVEEPVEAVEAPPEGPLVERSGGRALLHGGQVPLADGEGGPAGIGEDLGHGRGAV